ncbi:MAG: hypothetical protein M3290_13655 [Actinomycetota bacterium]|nr:hypothetical protein [Actinomycetota bacterium]
MRKQVPSTTVGFQPEQAALWQAVSEQLARDPTDDDLCMLAVEAVEPLIDLY